MALAPLGLNGKSEKHKKDLNVRNSGAYTLSL